MAKNSLFGIMSAIMLMFLVSSSFSQTSITVTPEQGLRNAINFAALSNVDSIILITSGGVYAEADTFTYQINKKVTIVAAPGLAEKPIIVNSNQGGTILEIFRVSNSFTLKGVVLDGGHPSSLGMKYGVRVGPSTTNGAPAVTGLNVTIQDCEFKNFYQYGSGQGHAFYFLKDVVAGTIRIEDCTIDGTGYEAIRMTETEKYPVPRCLDSLIIRNVTFKNVAAECIRFYSDLDTATTDSYVLMENLTIDKCNMRMAFIKNNKNSIMRNVIITNNIDGTSISGQNRTDYIMDVQSTGSIVSHVDTFNVAPIEIKSTKGGAVDTTTIYGFDPMYQDPDNFDYTLMTGSPVYGIGYMGAHLGDLRWAVNPPTSIGEELVGSADNYYLGQNYPNPFNPSTTIRYSISTPGYVSVNVFNLLGQKVETMVQDYRDAGTYELNFNATDLVSGIYIYTISVNEYTSSKKMILVK